MIKRKFALIICFRGAAFWRILADNHEKRPESHIFFAESMKQCDTPSVLLLFCREIIVPQTSLAIWGSYLLCSN